MKQKKPIKERIIKKYPSETINEWLNRIARYVPNVPIMEIKERNLNKKRLWNPQLETFTEK